MGKFTLIRSDSDTEQEMVALAEKGYTDAGVLAGKLNGDEKKKAKSIRAIFNTLRLALRTRFK